MRRWGGAKFTNRRMRLTFTPSTPLDSGMSYTMHIGGGMMMNDMTGPGWRHANGTYGMVFTFTTG